LIKDKNGSLNDRGEKKIYHRGRVRITAPI
jgi:hypothetical protein